MIKGSLARRYARALMAIGREREIYEQIGKELNSFVDLVREDKSLRESLSGPVFHHDLKEKIITELCSRLGLSEVVTNFLRVLNDKRRLDSVIPMADEYQAMADEASGRLRAEVISAEAMSADEESRVRKTLGQVTGKEVIMEVSTDPDIIGGLVTRIGGKLYDGSIRTQLKKIQEDLAKAG